MSDFKLFLSWYRRIFLFCITSILYLLAIKSHLLKLNIEIVKKNVMIDRGYCEIDRSADKKGSKLMQKKQICCLFFSCKLPRQNPGAYVTHNAT